MRRVLAEAWLGSREPLPEETFAALDPKQRRTMSRSAELSTAAALVLAKNLGWTAPQPDVGFFMGVGGSTGAMSEVDRLLKEGLDQAHPLYAFALMNNFTHAHPAIALGIGGPNATFFSRGRATWDALEEAWHCPGVVLVGGADCALHKVMRAELERSGSFGVLGEGAAFLALSPPGVPGVYLCAYGDGPAPEAERTVSADFEALAASPAIAWARAAALVRAGGAKSALAVASGVWALFQRLP